MDESLQAQIETSLSRLDHLIQRGRELREALAADPTDAFTTTATRVWQQDCGVTVNELSGSSKAHWLARSFSEAFLLRSAAGEAVEGASPAEIVGRLVGVLEQAVASLSRSNESAIKSASSVEPRRFDFVYDPKLRGVVEQAYIDARRALEQGQYDLALQTSCGVMEAIVTDALQHRGMTALAGAGAPAGKIADWSFETRLAVAERAGLIRGGWARLPAVAWAYRDQGARATATERNARQAGQVLHVVMRDLNPGR
jgi:hypothetical protein